MTDTTPIEVTADLLGQWAVDPSGPWIPVGRLRCT
jgi:hypothetical protein